MFGSVQAYFWLCVQSSFLVVLKGLYGISRIEPVSAICEAYTLPATLSLWTPKRVRILFNVTHGSLK